MRTLLLMGLVGAVAAGAARPDDKKADGKGTLGLTISVKEDDPKAPSKGGVKCVVKNGTDKAIEVPAEYTGHDGLVLHGNEVWLFPRKGAEKKAEKAKVEPGKERTAFELPLDDILLQTKEGKEKWLWTWDKRPA